MKLNIVEMKLPIVKMKLHIVKMKLHIVKMKLHIVKMKPRIVKMKPHIVEIKLPIVEMKPYFVTLPVCLVFMRHVRGMGRGICRIVASSRPDVKFYLGPGEIQMKKNRMTSVGGGLYWRHGRGSAFPKAPLGNGENAVSRLAGFRQTG